jgi:16S rRNA (uracil1498-N3)-methyltransferase
VSRQCFAAGADAVAHAFAPELSETVVLDGDDGHHLGRVRRLHASERVTLADGTGEWRAYAVEDVRGGTVSLRAVGETFTEPGLEPSLAVAVALTKGTKPEVVVRGVTELGVDAIIPVVAARSVARIDESGPQRLSTRLSRVAREAAMQCRRARVPEIAAPVRLLELAGRPGLVLADRGAAAGDHLPDPHAGWTLLVGPEGGLASEELAALAEVPRVGVGPHVLRAETAAVAAAAVLSARRRPVAG